MSETPLALVVVDDNPEDRAEVRRLLLLGSERRYRFTEAETGAAALTTCLAGPGGPPGCVILNYHLPDMDVREVLAGLRAGGLMTVCPVLVLTGGAGPRRGPDVLRAGAQDYLDKSWLNSEILGRAVDNAIERHRLAREARAAEAALRQSEEQLRMALQASNTGLWFRDLQTGVVTWSPECYRIHDMTEGDFAGTADAFLALVYAEDRERLEATMRAAITGRTRFECEFRIVRPSGEIAWVMGRGGATYDAAGRPLEVHGTATDISRRKGAEVALREADRRKDEFLATLAHELRNPLAPLRNGLIALGRAAPGKDTSRLRAMMDRQLGNFVHLIDDLLDISRISTGKVELVREQFELRRVVEAALETSRPLLDAAGHVLSVRLPEAPVWLDGDLTRLAQVLSNLLNNAAKYTPAHGWVELMATVSGDQVVIRVADNGCGIPREMLSQVFDKFTQVDRTLSRAQGGLGIGLSLVRGLVELHGGQVTAESAGPGQGSTFTVRLPRVVLTEQTERAIRKVPEPPRGPTRRILVIDDNIDAANSLAEVLQLSGHEVRAVYSSTDALVAARRLQPEVIFLDIGLPGMDGYDVARLLRAEPILAGTVLIALTGWGGAADRRRSQEAGFDYHLTKPADRTAVEELLTRLVPTRGRV